jgi:hypothetical protein
VVPARREHHRVTATIQGLRHQRSRVPEHQLFQSHHAKFPARHPSQPCPVSSEVAAVVAVELVPAVGPEEEEVVAVAVAAVPPRFPPEVAAPAAEPPPGRTSDVGLAATEPA